MLAKILDGKTYDEVDAMFVKYIVTGRYYNSDRKFRTSYTRFIIANQINLWNGRVWGVTKEGKRKLLKTVIN